jgi:hypothetical protein
MKSLLLVLSTLAFGLLVLSHTVCAIEDEGTPYYHFSCVYFVHQM